MKKIVLLFHIVLYSLFAQCQNEVFMGDWLGKIKTSGIELRIAFHISKLDGIYLTKLDSPDQNVFGTPANKTTVLNNDSIIIEFPLMGAIYNGIFKNNKIEGVFHQSGFDLPLIMSHYEGDLKAPQRPQEPKGPFSYKEKEVKIKTPDEKVKLCGTLTTPETKGPHPAVLLISGSGQQNRDEELMGHKPFLVLADYLTRNGIAVLRYDDRGVGKSTGDYKNATTLDFATDAEAAFNFLAKQKHILKNKIGIIGHSEGGLIAPIIASHNNKVSFIVLMAGPSVPGSIIIPDQQELILKASGEQESEVKKQFALNKQIVDYIAKNTATADIQQDLAKNIENWMKELKISVPKSTSVKTFARQSAYSMSNSWMRSFITLSPQHYINKVECPILALFGENDLQVSVRANLEPMQQLLAHHNNSKVHVFPKLNHLFQTSETGNPSEYPLIEETLSPDFMAYVKNWILQLP